MGDVCSEPSQRAWLLPDTYGRAVLAAIVSVATSGRSWRQLMPVFASWQTVHRCFTGWSAARVGEKLHRTLPDRHEGDQGADLGHQRWYTRPRRRP
ncbi:transposase [Streptomyces sp. NPDC087512]|uniref:transposase n=1 Tax=Streptomyces sp. NPDC087512 TaxID=3155059 RepID=UPI00342C9EBB